MQVSVSTAIAVIVFGRKLRVIVSHPEHGRYSNIRFTTNSETESCTVSNYSSSGSTGGSNLVMIKKRSTVQQRTVMLKEIATART